MLPLQLLQTFGISDLFLDLLSCESQKSKLHDKRDKRDKRTVPKVVATSVARCYPVRVIPSPPEAFARWDSPAKRHAASSRCQTLNDRASNWNKHQTVTNWSSRNLTDIPCLIIGFPWLASFAPSCTFQGIEPDFVQNWILLRPALACWAEEVYLTT